MPIYDFKCLDCDRVSEILAGVNAPAPPCPECGSSKMKRQMSTTFKVIGGGREPKKTPQPSVPRFNPETDPEYREALNNAVPLDK